jgi:hypothetical protein
MDKNIQAFINHIPYDKEYVEELLNLYDEIIKTLGHFISIHSKTLWCRDEPELQELLDFIDGNGFEVVYNPTIIPPDAWVDRPIKIVPIYFEEENEELTFTEYVSVEETGVYYTSTTINEDYVPQYQELYIPRPLRILSPRRMELLRVVPARRSRSTSLPRPP